MVAHAEHIEDKKSQAAHLGEQSDFRYTLNFYKYLDYHTGMKETVAEHANLRKFSATTFVNEFY
jgi:hypothetical protein